MRRHLRIGTSLICLLSLAVFAHGSKAHAGVYTEGFTSKQYCDTLNTTAWWDTVAGELRLPFFDLTPAGSLDTPGTAYGVVVAGDYAFVADGASGLQVIDVTDPTGPDSAGTYDTPGLAHGVAINGVYAYVADRVAGIQVVDISDPANPAHAGDCSTPGSAYAVAVSGDYLYVADYASGLRVIDIGDPTSPASAGSCATPGYAFGVAVSGDYAYVADGNSGLLVVDISDPTNPDSAGNFAVPGNARCVAISGDYAYVTAANTGIQVVDISDPTNPTYAGSYDTPGTADGISISGDWLYVADRASGLQVLDVTDPTDPTPAGSLDTPGQAKAVAIAGDYAFVADEGSGLQVIDIAEQMLPLRLAGELYTPGGAREVVISGNYLYVADYGAGLQIVDISDPADPVLAATHDTPGTASDLAVSGNYAYVADDAGGLQVVDISDPSNPDTAGSYAGGIFSDIAISGDHAYVTYDRDFWVIDLSDPANPNKVGEYVYSEKINDVVVSGDHAYLAVKSDALVVLDISDPAAPVFVAQASGGGGQCLEVAGDHVFMSVSTDFRVVDISDPTNPATLGSVTSPERITEIEVHGDYAFCAAQDTGLVIFDISDPTTPTYIESYHTPDYATGVAHAGDYTYVTDLSAGLLVLETFQRSGELLSNVGYSLDLEPGSTVYAVRLSTTQTDSIKWEVSADSGAHWQEILRREDWQPLTYIGDNLLWRSQHSYTEPGTMPVCSHLKIEYTSDLSWLGVVLSDTAVSFGTVGAGEVHTRKITIFNYLPDPVQIYVVGLDGEVFTTDLTTMELPARSSHDFNVYFFSEQNNDFVDFLTIAVSVGDLPLLVRLSAEPEYADSYYDATRNLCGEELKTVLHGLIDEHTVLGYTMARDSMYGHIDNHACPECPDTGCVECVYTGRVECFNTRIGAGNKGFNCEHTWPQSFFCSVEPMVSDIFHLYPTDMTSNNRRGRYDFGIVVSPIWSEGGSSLGDDADGLTVFEPRDGHKGNVARTHFYFIVRYAAARRESCSSYEAPAKMETHIRDWHVSDPVDTRERERNEDICVLQGNRNPFIDHPEFVDRISSFFGTASCSAEPEIAVSPMEVDLGAIGFNSTAHYDIAVMNSGDDTLVVSSITPTDPDFSVDTTGFALAPGTHDYVRVTYTSGEMKLRDSTGIHIACNDSDENLVDVSVVVEVEATSGLARGDDIPPKFCLYPNYPNPFGRTTNIKYGLPHTAHVELSIYDVLGRKVLTLVDGKQNPGYLTALWDGRDHRGARVASGIYFVRLETGPFTHVHKMILLR